MLVRESLNHVGPDEVYVVAGDGTQTPRSSRKIEGTGWLQNLRTPHFMVGIHYAQRWFNGSWLVPAEKGCSRAIPLRWLPAFTEKATCEVSTACKEWEATVLFLDWLRGCLVQAGRPDQRVLMVGDGSYDTLKLWQQLPNNVTLFARSAKNRALYNLPLAQTHGNRQYGERPYATSVLEETYGLAQIDIIRAQQTASFAGTG